MRLLSLLFAFLISTVALFAQELPKPGEPVYTVQVGSFTDKKEALEVYSKVADLPGARVVHSRRYKVRVGFFKTYREAKEFCKEVNLSSRVSDYYVTRVRFYPRFLLKLSELSVNRRELQPQVEVLSYSVEKPEPKSYARLRNESEKVEEEFSKLKGEKAVALADETKPKGSDGRKEVKVEVKRKEKKGERSFPLLPVLLGFAAVGVLLFLFRKRSFSRSTPESLAARLLADGKYEELIEFAVPYLQKNPKDTFVKKALAESYEKLGKYLEAAALYEEISKELEEKGLNILAEGFKRKADELYAAEFKGRG